MNERVIQFRVGVVVVAATIITGIMIMLFGEGKALVREQYTIYMGFPQAPGVTIDTPVRKHGVLIGRVTRVELLDPEGVKLTARIDGNRKLYGNEICVIKTASFLGDAVLEFEAEGPIGPQVQDGDFLADGVVASNPLEVLTDLKGTMESAIGSIESAAREVELLAQGLNRALGSNDNQIQRIMQKSELALEQFNRTMATIDDLVSDPQLKEGLKQSLRDLPLIMNDVQQTLSTARQTMAGFDRVSRRAEQNLQFIENFTRPLGERGEQLVDDIGTSIQNLNLISTQLVTFSEALNDREGTLGRFLYDRELYDNLDEFVSNINTASRRIQPIMNDVRIFTDKIARDPRQLGVKGALDARPVGVGLK